MSAPFTLQDILVSIADSLSQAQQKLNSMPIYDSFGNPVTTFQLPYLDFNIVLETTFSTNEISEDISDDQAVSVPYVLQKKSFTVFNRPRIITFNSETSPRKPQQLLTKTGDDFLYPLPMRGPDIESNPDAPTGVTPEPAVIPNSTEDNGDAGADIESNKSYTTLSGRFVAVLPNLGLPQTILNVAYEKDQAVKTNTYIIKVNVFNSAGEKLAYQRVEFNFDEDITYSLNYGIIAKLFEDGDIKKDFKIKPKFASQEEFTNEEGYTETKVTFDDLGIKKKLMIVIKVNLGTIAKSISIEI
jgi:hypothetical protein